MSVCIFIFRRDLRIQDNTGLLHALKEYDNVIPVYVFTPEQITQKNKYRSPNAIRFMLESMKDLNKNLIQYKSKLHIIYGKNEDVIIDIINQENIDAVVTNMDYTPYAKKRDERIRKICKKHNILFDLIEDYLLAPIGTFLKDDEQPYKVYSPFYNNVLKKRKHVQKPNKHISSFNKLVKFKNVQTISVLDLETNDNPNILVKGGRQYGLKYLSKINNFKNYESTRNTMSYSTTHLSAYIKFGCISIREVFWKLQSLFGYKHGIISQLIWREFFYYIGNYFPNVLKGEPFNSKYKYLDKRWRNDALELGLWKKGETGFPIVDAGMRELNATGYMHNRARLITSNFLNRIYGQDWRNGEMYFAQHLTDYDPLVNNGNWQWIASVGVDTKPYFQRVFNPWLQSERYDETAEYIKKWIPELKNVKPKHIHKWNVYCKDERYINVDYPVPSVNYSKRREASLKMFSTRS